MNFQQAVTQYQANPTREALRETAKALRAELTEAEKLRMLSGRAIGPTVRGVAKAGRVYNETPYPAGGCARLGIPDVNFADGPRGIVPGNSSSFPAAMARGASFDPELEARVGTAMAKEAAAQGANYYAGICINLLRNPRWGRAQESYGEDPFLLGKMGETLTKVMQENGIMACPKHYACNSIENMRFRVNVTLSDRALHEVYLPHFKKCVDAGAVSMMGAYNLLRGEQCCESHLLLTEILRDTWGFEGFTISDFLWGVRDARRAVGSGMDIEMPYTMHYRKLKKYLESGEIQMADIDQSVENIIKGQLQILPNWKPQDRSVVACKEHAALAREAAEKGTVLLKNDGILPLHPQSLSPTAQLAVIGRYADVANTGDHGSSNVYSPYVVTPYQGLCALYGAACVAKDDASDLNRTAALAKNSAYVLAVVGGDYKQEGEYVVPTQRELPFARKLGTGGDRRSLRLQQKDIRLLVKLAEANPNLIVMIQGGSAYLIDEWLYLAKGVLMSFYGGMEGGTALANLISGEVNPSGKLPFTVAAQEDDYPLFLFPEDGTEEIEYGYYHGYTLLDKAGKQAAYPFGFGLSYTSFALDSLAVEDAGGTLNVSVTVKNTGPMAGDEVVQVYAGSKNMSEDRPVKLLKGFARVSLSPGEERTVSVAVVKDDLRFYCPQSKSWVLDEAYTIYAGNNAENAMELSCGVILG